MALGMHFLYNRVLLNAYIYFVGHIQVLNAAPDFVQYYPSTKYTNAATQWTPIMNQRSNSYSDRDHGFQTDASALPTDILNPVPDSDNFDRRAEPTLTEGAFCRRSFDGRAGYCIMAQHCLHVIHEHRVHGIPVDICTHRKSIPVICCPLSEKSSSDNRQQRISARKCQEYHEEARSYKVMEPPQVFSGKQCMPSLPLIVGGEVTRTGAYPHMAALGWSEAGDVIKWRCGGALISDNYVLTASHCINSASGKPPDIVRLGAQNLNRTSAEQQDIKILVIIMHPKYKSSAYYHDIALLKLIKNAVFSQYVRPACLWQLPELEMPTITAAGWGRTKFLGPQSRELRKVTLNLIDQALCQTFYGKERRLPRGIIDEQFCAGDLAGGKDTCQGDSGGPLHAELPELNCVQFVVGITSFGKFCAAPNSPGVYTRVYAYLDWIEKIVFRN